MEELRFTDAEGNELIIQKIDVGIAVINSPNSGFSADRTYYLGDRKAIEVMDFLKQFYD